MGQESLAHSSCQCKFLLVPNVKLRNSRPVFMNLVIAPEIQVMLDLIGHQVWSNLFGFTFLTCWNSK
jgi:hypothetical protein